MAKASSRIRLEAGLMESATIAGELHNRSAAEQVEFLASIGQSVAKHMTANDILELKAGLMSVVLEKNNGAEVDSAQLLSEIDTARASGALSQAILSGGPRYQMAHDRPGLLEQVLPNGETKVGQFVDGVFKEVE